MPHDLDCAAVQVLLLPMVNGQLTPPLNERIKEHLGRCSICREDYAELQAIQRQMTAMVEQLPPAPDILWSKLQLATSPELESRSEPLDLLSSCLNLLSILGVPEWATQPVIRSVNLAKDLRDDLLNSRIPDLSRIGLVIGSN